MPNNNQNSSQPKNDPLKDFYGSSTASVSDDPGKQAPSVSDPVSPDVADSGDKEPESAGTSFGKTSQQSGSDFSDFETKPSTFSESVDESESDPLNDTDSTSPYVPKKYGGKKIMATIFSVFFVTAAIAAGVILVQREQNLQEKATGGDEGSDGDWHETVCYNGQTLHIDDDDWQDWINRGATDGPCPSTSPTTQPTATPGPTGVGPQSCPGGTEMLFTKSGGLSVGDGVSAGGSIASLDGSWSVGSQNGVLMAESGKRLSVNFSSNVLLDSALIYDNDPKEGESPWSVNGVSLPATENNKWAPVFSLNLTTNQMSFDYGGDSPHFNICVKAAETTNTPTPEPTATPTLPPQITAKCNKVNAYDLDDNGLTAGDLSQLTAGEFVRFAVSGQASSGSFTKARFTVNGTSLGESTTKNGNNEFYIDYEIPANTTSFSVKGEVFHDSLGWM